jgi:uncharacterized protein YkwD
MTRIGIVGGVCAVVSLAASGSAPALGPPALDRAAVRPSVARMTAPPTLCAGENDLSATIKAQEGAMACMVNFARQRAGLPKLRDSGTLDGSAANKGGDILRCNQFSHEACGRNFLYWFRRSGYLPTNCWWAGENLAWGTAGLGSARSVLRAWLRSPPHRANILDPDYHQLGLDLQIGNLAGASDAHLWVNHFGAHC